MRAVVLGLILLALSGTGARALAKPKIAILGLEVVGTVDPDQVKLAKLLTNALRERAAAGTGPYELAPNSDKELVDEKLMNNCGSEALTCMSPIGLALKADYLMYGKIEKVDRGYHVTIKLIRVATKMPLPTYSDIVAATEMRNDPRGVAKRAYARMTASDEGTVTVRVANVDRATVYVDGEPMGTTSSGVLTISLPEGRHRLAIVANEKGFRRHEEELAVNAGDQRNIPVELARVSSGDARPTGPSDGEIRPPGGALAREGAVSDAGESRAGWRVMFALSVATALGSGAVWVYGYNQIREAEDDLFQLCGTERPCSGDPALLKVHNEKGEQGRLLSWVGAAGVGVGALFGAITLYKGFIASPEKRAVGGAFGRARGPRRTLAVTPLVSPTSGGATLRFDW